MRLPERSAETSRKEAKSCEARDGHNSEESRAEAVLENQAHTSVMCEVCRERLLAAHDP